MLEVEIIDDARTLTGATSTFIRDLVRFAASELDLSGESLTIALVDAPEMRKLHSRYFGDSADTDVITFPGYEPDETEPGSHIGDIVICVNVAAEQAKDQQHDYATEVGFLALHGILHIAGYDDRTDSERAHMLGMQEQLMREFKVLGGAG